MMNEEKLQKLAEKNNVELSTANVTEEERITILEDAFAELCVMVMNND